jgi:hypothetical protein
MIRNVPPTPPVVLVSLPAQLTPQNLINSPIKATLKPIINVQIVDSWNISINTKKGIGV